MANGQLPVHPQMHLTRIPCKKNVIPEEETVRRARFLYGAIAGNTLLTLRNREVLQGERPRETLDHLRRPLVRPVGNNNDLDLREDRLLREAFEALAQNICAFMRRDDDGEGKVHGK